jgi:AbrB family looped-hinge helix DNA binding protein
MPVGRVPAIFRAPLDEYNRQYDISGYRKFLPTIATSQGAAMPLVKIQEKGQVTLPAKIRHEVGLNSGDLVMIEKEGDRIVLIPQAVVARDPVTDAAITEGLEDIRAGRVTPAFPTMEALEAWLRSDEGKKFSKS